MEHVLRTKIIKFGNNQIHSNKKTYWNLSTTELVEQSILNREGKLSQSGALMVKTGEFTGRSPDDRFIVDHSKVSDQEIAWGNANQPISPGNFQKLLSKVTQHINNVPIYIEDVLVGALQKHQRRIRIVSEYAWAALFARDLFIPSPCPFKNDADFTVIHAPTFAAEPMIDGTSSSAFVIINFEERVILIGNTKYAGEIKKSVFSVMNRILPVENVLPMHCSANVGIHGDAALFFGLSGTGKTTLSSDPDRYLIGDDEHGWGAEGIFNFEGGCYAKMIRLDKVREPIIWEASQKFGSVLENVVFDEHTREIDFLDDSITENTRAAYPLKYVQKRINSGCGDHPQNIFFLCADAFGVLPPIAALSIEQAEYFFLSGYTSKLAGTERGIGTEPEATFSACFGAPFLPLNPVLYAKMLSERLNSHQSQVWLINTGWTGGAYGVGTRINLQYTRAMISAVLNSILKIDSFKKEPIFGLKIPNYIEGVPSELLNPGSNWRNSDQYISTAKMLHERFQKNITQYDCFNGINNIARLEH